MRLDKILQSQGFGTRRTCRSLIEQGDVLVNGVLFTNAEAEVSVESLWLTVRGLEWRFLERVSLMLHKPAGTECSRGATHHPPVFSLLPEFLVARGVQPVGRLDVDTTGLLLMSDDGALIQRVTSPKHHIEKEYLVTCSDEVSELQFESLRSGVQLSDAVELVRATAIERRSARQLSLTITEGKYHQVRRMIAAVGNHVVALHRLRIGPIVLSESLPPGQHRLLSSGEVTSLVA